MFWKLLDKLGLKQGNETLKNSISPNKWAAHFQNDSYNHNTKKPLPQNTKEEGPIDYSISDEEIKLGLYILKEGKSIGHDGVSNKVLAF